MVILKTLERHCYIVVIITSLTNEMTNGSLYFILVISHPAEHV